MATDPHHHGADDEGPIKHETTDINLEGVGKIIIGFVVFLIAVAVAMYGTFAVFQTRDAADQRDLGPMVERAEPGRPRLFNKENQVALPDRIPAGPKLLTSEPANLRDFRTEQATRLQTYGWTDQGNRVVHLPIERAMALIVERGLPGASASAPGAEAAAGEGAETPAHDPVEPGTTPATPRALENPPPAPGAAH